MAHAASESPASRSSHRATVACFAAWVLLLLTATGLRLWQNHLFALEQRRVEAAATLGTKGSTQFFYAAPRPRDGKQLTRADFEAQIPDPKAVAARKWTNPETGEIFDEVTYHDPRTGGRIRVSYLKGVVRGMGSSGEFDPVPLRSPPLWDYAQYVHIRIRALGGWAWAAALLWYLFSATRRDRLNRSLLLLAIALAFAAATFSAPTWNWWRVRHDETLIWAVILLAVSSCIAIVAWLRRTAVDPLICATCGYDLRATPERCPECGTPALRRDFTRRGDAG